MSCRNRPGIDGEAICVGEQGVIDLELVCREEVGAGDRRRRHSGTRARLDSQSFHLVKGPGARRLVQRRRRPAIDRSKITCEATARRVKRSTTRRSARGEDEKKPARRTLLGARRELARPRRRHQHEDDSDTIEGPGRGLNGPRRQRSPPPRRRALDLGCARHDRRGHARGPQGDLAKGGSRTSR